MLSNLYTKFIAYVYICISILMSDRFCNSVYQRRKEDKILIMQYLHHYFVTAANLEAYITYGAAVCKNFLVHKSSNICLMGYINSKWRGQKLFSIWIVRVIMCLKALILSRLILIRNFKPLNINSGYIRKNMIPEVEGTISCWEPRVMAS